MEPAPAPEWTADDAARLRELMSVEYEGESLRDYTARVSPRLPIQRHIEPVVDALEEARAASRDPKAGIRFILIEQPPRHGKTTAVMHGLSWRVSRDPAITNAYITHGQDLADSKSRMMRGMAERGGVNPAPDMWKLEEWRTVEGGGVIAGSIMGPLTGKGIDGFLVVDDPIKNRQEAESETYREAIWEQFTDVCFTRLEGSATVIIMMTRWHPDDLIGRILDKQAELEEELGGAITIIRIRLPAIAENDNDLLGRKVGEALWPARYDERRLGAIRAVLGEYSWSSMYQQDPRVRGAVLFIETPARFMLYDPEGRPLWQPNGHRMLIGCDPAATAKTKADYSAAYVMAAQGWGHEMRTWIVDGFRRQCSIPELVRMLQELRQRWYGIAVCVEAVSAFKAVPDMLREVDPLLPVMEAPVQGDKFTRAQGVSAAWNQGRVEVPLDARWAPPLIRVCSRFTGLDDAEDDDVDAIAHGWNALYYAELMEQARGSVMGNFLPFG